MTTEPSSQKNKKDFSNGLDTPIQFCPSVGPKRASLFAKLGIYSIYDLFWHLPRAYEDYHTLTEIKQVKPGQTATITGVVSLVENRIPKTRTKVKSILKAVVDDASGSLTAIWFNQPYLAGKVKQGVRLLLHGKTDIYDGFLQISAPKVEIIDGELHAGIVPVYPLTDGLTQAVIRKILQIASERFSQEWEEIIPETITKNMGLFDRQKTFRILHQPQPGEGAPAEINTEQINRLQTTAENAKETDANAPAGDPETPWGIARRRLVFEEFFIHQFVHRAYSRKQATHAGISHPLPEPSPWGEKTACTSANPKSWPALFVWNLPYQLTEDQTKVCQEFEKDMHQPKPMNRLLQGDVGSGKTVASVYAMILSAAGGHQAALMAPTELLAQQHARNIQKFCTPIPGLRIVVLSGSTKSKERKQILEEIEKGSAHIIVGTHALFQEQVSFANLGLVVVDEQHKFGVNQRQKLVEKGNNPDLLVTTATPIPRTLSLTLFGDMEISVIKSMPPGRPELISRWTHWDKEDKVWEFIDSLIAKGQQAYVVCPIIEPSEEAPHLPSTEEAFEKLSQTFFPHRKIAVLHGKHSFEEKEILMQRMISGEIDVVVATTVIEVGVDLPNATAMVILGADRFGLAQLHQLRGRVGRGTEKSYCVLITPERISEFAEKRMRCMEKTRDGFLIAEEDMRLRGPGEHFGARQSGHFNFRVADPFLDEDLLKEAHQAANAVYKEDPSLKESKHAPLKREITRLYRNFSERRPS